MFSQPYLIRLHNKYLEATSFRLFKPKFGPDTNLYCSVLAETAVRKTSMLGAGIDSGSRLGTKLELMKQLSVLSSNSDMCVHIDGRWHHNQCEVRGRHMFSCCDAPAAGTIPQSSKLSAAAPTATEGSLSYFVSIEMVVMKSRDPRATRLKAPGNKKPMVHPGKGLHNYRGQ